MRQRATAQTAISNRGRPSLASQVAALFAAMSGPKLWLDPSDPATRFQDQAGTTLVTADGQPYGRANDKSGGGNHVGQVTTTSRPLWRTDGALSWALADGTDDSWVSLANFDCTPTDKMTIVVGLLKESDFSVGIAYELGDNSGVNPGTFSLSMPEASNNPLMRTRLRGATALAQGDVSIAAPATFVRTTLLDLSAATAPLAVQTRINGVASGVGAGSTPGGGNFASALFNIFRRNNATLPAKVRLYGLMIFGRLLTADELSLCERYMAQKTGVVLP